MTPVLIRLCAAMWVCQEAQQKQSEFVDDLKRLRELDGTITALSHVPAPNTTMVLRTVGRTIVLKSNYGDIPTRVITVRTEATSNELTGSAMPVIFVVPEDHL
ncbi:hypothetical protein HJG54_15745 [Leptolyngbya sp. NK1-12]|uniref:Uncharacterized protein n=1 Tax=Leptolyngbya sp. NK1-12 TaxID=2547451 RepID=A0AA97AGC6_9CYAN|nr:hypothetical protein [Leptolyngbya sp. NK1-12]WNZ24165.1 hypothetical protein HJG54_15745 [Leptolyngbya sp. NK1-12]